MGYALAPASGCASDRLPEPADKTTPNTCGSISHDSGPVVLEGIRGAASRTQRACAHTWVGVLCDDRSHLHSNGRQALAPRGALRARAAAHSPAALATEWCMSGCGLLETSVGECPRGRSSVTSLAAATVTICPDRPRCSWPAGSGTLGAFPYPRFWSLTPRLASNRPCWSRHRRRTPTGTPSSRRSARRRSASSAMRAECSADRSTRSSPTDTACTPLSRTSLVSSACCRRNR